MFGKHDAAGKQIQTITNEELNPFTTSLNAPVLISIIHRYQNYFIMAAFIVSFIGFFIAAMTWNKVNNLTKYRNIGIIKSNDLIQSKDVI